jgi:uncharacterized membrane protein YadS
MNIYIILGLVIIIILMFEQQFINKEKNNKIEIYFDQIKVPLFISCFIIIIYNLYFNNKSELIIKTKIPQVLLG